MLDSFVKDTDEYNMMGCQHLHPIVLIVSILMCVHGEYLQDVQRVLNDYFSPPNYNKLIRGVLDQHKAVEVNLTFSLLSLTNVNEVGEMIEVMGVLCIAWVDERLVWNPADYNDTRVVNAFQNEIWKPEVVLSNPANVVSVLGNDRIMAAVYHNGTVLWRVGDLFKFYCSLDVTAYPWDKQSCPLKFIVWGYYSNAVQLMAPSERVDLGNYVGNGAWELESATCTMEGPSIPTVQFTINIQRYSKFALVNVLMPVFTLTVLNLFAFFIPPASGEKLSYCITVLLALAVFLSIVADHLPGNSNNMALLCYFLMFVLMISTFICISSVLSIRFHYMAESGVPPQWLRRIMSKFKCKRPLNVSQDGVMSLNETPRHVFEEFKQYQGDSTETSDDNVTWQDSSRFVNNVACIITISLLIVSTIVFVIFISSK